jgi:hypothetical protein
MKYWGISYGKIIEGFCIFPSICVNWARLQVKDKISGNYNRYYDIQFVWLFWYFTIGQIKK